MNKTTAYDDALWQRVEAAAAELESQSNGGRAMTAMVHASITWRIAQDLRSALAVVPSPPAAQDEAVELLRLLKRWRTYGEGQDLARHLNAATDDLIASHDAGKVGK